MATFETPIIHSFSDDSETTSFWAAYDRASDALNNGERVRNIRIINAIAKDAAVAGERLEQSAFPQIDAGIDAAISDFAGGIKI